MTHDELLAKLSDLFAFDDKGHALRAVVELHRPEHSIRGYRCNVCDSLYPCSTIEAIEKELS